MAFVLAALVASALDPVKLLLAFLIGWALRTGRFPLALLAMFAVASYIIIASALSSMSGAQVLIHFASSVFLVGLAVLLGRLWGSKVSGAIGLVLTLTTVAMIWSVASPSMQSTTTYFPGLANETDMAPTKAGGSAGQENRPIGASTSSAELYVPAELHWLESQPSDYQQAVARGELLEDETGQRQVGLLVRTLTEHFEDDPSAGEYLSSTAALPLLLELRAALAQHLSGAQDQLDYHLAFASSSVRTNPRVQSLLTELVAQANSVATD